jgi:hypothetical protein
VEEERVSLAYRGRDALEIVTTAQQNLESEWAALLGSADYGELRTHLNSRITTASPAGNPRAKQAR